jgi:hypothetical protein
MSSSSRISSFNRKPSVNHASFGRAGKTMAKYLGVPAVRGDPDLEAKANDSVQNGVFANKLDFVTYGVMLISRWHNQKVCVVGTLAAYITRIGEKSFVRLERSPLMKLHGFNVLAGCNKPMIAIPVVLNTNGKFSNHANMLLVNRKHKTIEHFEPHGQKADHLSDEENEMLVIAMKTLVTKHYLGLKGKYTFVERAEVCPLNISPQGFGSDTSVNNWGTCALWSLWYLHMRMANPYVHGVDAVYKALIKIDDKKEFMYQFAMEIMATSLVEGYKF